MATLLNLLKRLFCRRRNSMIQYEVKDEHGNVVAVFLSESNGPFTVAQAPEVQPEGGGGPGEER